jgi:transcriptional regulator with XRE-family HTH domain
MYKLNLRELRKEKNVTQNEIAQYLKVSRETYSQYETGRHQMNYETLFLLADYYDITIDYLLGRCETNPISVSKNETHLINTYRLLDERGKATIEANLNFEYEQSNINKESKKVVG